MPIVPATPPEAVPLTGGFDYVTVDAARRRVYAAHTADRALLIVDADSGRLIGQVRVGTMHGVAVNPESGHVYTGDGVDRTVSEVDPATQRVVARADVDGPVDAIAYDAALHRIYADEDDGTRIFVIDARTMRQVAIVALPGHKPEYLAIDPSSHDVYQNIDDLHEIAVIDPRTLRVTRTIRTSGIRHNHPLQYDAALRQIVVGGQTADGRGAELEAYAPGGESIGAAPLAGPVDQCDLDERSSLLACAGHGQISVVRLRRDAAPQLVATVSVPAGAHTIAIDAQTTSLWIVWASPEGDYIRRFDLRE